MRALHLTDTGNSVLAYSTTTPMPSLSPTHYVVRVCCTAITTSELTWPMVTSRTNAIPGHDLSGIVVSTPTNPPEPPVEPSLRGRNDGDAAKTHYAPNDDMSDHVKTHQFYPGDEVYALTAFDRDGSAAEYVHVHPKELAAKPRHMSHEEAACIPLSYLTAAQAILQDIRSQGEKDGVLVLGATGGVGVMAVQLVRWKGVTVVATCGARNMEFAKSLGATEVLDYSQGFRVLEGRKFGLVIDTVGGEWQDKAWEWIAEGGSLVSVHSPLDEDRQQEYKGRVNGVYFIVEPNGRQLSGATEIADKGGIRAVVDRVFELEDGAKAFEKLSEGHVKGKIVLRVME